MWKQLLVPPKREYVFIGALVLALSLDVFIFSNQVVLFVVAALAALPTMWSGTKSLIKKKISIDTFNGFALLVTFVTWEISSAAFIGLMLSFARLLDWYTESRTHHAVEELLKLKPTKAIKDVGGVLQEVDVNEVKKDDILVVKTGARVPVDGVVTYGSGFVNEASVTGESALVQKVIGDDVFSSTLNESGALKIKATHVGKDSIIERMAALVDEAAKHKSQTQKIADRFAQIFLPIIAIIGAITFIVTRDINMTIALFLVACADDIAVSIPLAMTASLGQAAKRGVIVKGGQWLDALGKIKILVLDKTGTLTHGKLEVTGVDMQSALSKKEFWTLIGATEKFSEHPMGKAVLREAAQHVQEILEPDDFRVLKSDGVWARIGTTEVAIGDDGLFKHFSLRFSEDLQKRYQQVQQTHQETTLLVFINSDFAGFIRVGDKARPEAAAAIHNLKSLGIERIIMLTGDNEHVAQQVASAVGIKEFRSSMTPEGKYAELDQIKSKKIIAMIGDGINDAPALARADVGIAMGGGGTAVAVETADVVVLTDNLSRLPEMIQLGRRTTSVIHGDIIMWFITNAVGFIFVFTGIFGPALAALFNFVTDFLPIINSSRLFGWKGWTQRVRSLAK
ncbi:MAG: cation-translocating P-type ATPase [Patescibacteria group bacterium]|jgi:Cd2+/Zn2+-exporting ATPase